MKNTDNIIILKCDVNKAPNKYLINPVEYKFINSRTGKELDATSREHNSFRISYPLHGVINRYDNNRKKRKEIEYAQIVPSDENYSEIYFDEDHDNYIDIKHDKGFIGSIKKEQRLVKKIMNFLWKIKNIRILF